MNARFPSGIAFYFFLQISDLRPYGRLLVRNTQDIDFRHTLHPLDPARLA